MPTFHIINRFLEDTCVLAASAYILSRGALLASLFNASRTRRSRLALVALFAVFGATEVIFPGDRYPYVPFTLAGALAGYTGGMAVGIYTALGVTILSFFASLLGIGAQPVALYGLSTLAAGIAGALVARAIPGVRPGLEGDHHPLAPYLIGATLAGAIAEMPHAVAGYLIMHLASQAGPADLAFLYSVAANAFGSAMVGYVLWDANERRLAVLRRVEAEQEIASLRLSQLSQLQARLHPHFLFNALAAIAGLCVINPMQAEKGVTDLAEVLRQLLRSPSDVFTSLRDELNLVDRYVAIEKIRLGDRLTVRQSCPAAVMTNEVPRFSVQVLVENAVQHGIVPSMREGKVTISGRARPGWLILCVADNGSGFVRGTPLPASPKGETRASDRPHALNLLAGRLHLAYGERGRMRILTRPGDGTLCAIQIPTAAADSAKR